jgi:sugar (pentulose or hexulose) kinase
MTEEDQEIRQRVVKWANVADYCVYLLTGELVASPSLAGRSGLLDRRKLDWSDNLLRAGGLSADQLPTVRGPMEVAGTVNKQAHQTFGIPEGTPVVNVGHDHPAAMVGSGLVSPGTAIDSTGTSEALATLVESPLGYRETNGGTYDCYAGPLRGSYVLSGHLPSSGGVVGWLGSLSNGDRTDNDDEQDITALFEEAGDSLIGAGGVRVLPFLDGTGSPFNDRPRSAEIRGLRSHHERGDLVRAALEGTAYWLQLNLSVLGQLANIDTTHLVATGGGSHTRLWLEIKAAIAECALDVVQVPEAAGLGAALVAGLSVGIPNSVAGLPGWRSLAAERVAADPLAVDAYRPIVGEYEKLFRQEI